MHPATAKCEKKKKNNNNNNSNNNFLTENSHLGLKNTAIGSVGLDNVQFVFKHYNNSF